MGIRKFVHFPHPALVRTCWTPGRAISQTLARKPCSLRRLLCLHLRNWITQQTALRTARTPSRSLRSLSSCSSIPFAASSLSASVRVHRILPSRVCTQFTWVWLPPPSTSAAIAATTSSNSSSKTRVSSWRTFQHRKSPFIALQWERTRTNALRIWIASHTMRR